MWVLVCFPHPGHMSASCPEPVDGRPLYRTFVPHLLPERRLVTGQEDCVSCQEPGPADALRDPQSWLPARLLVQRAPRLGSLSGALLSPLSRCWCQGPVVLLGGEAPEQDSPRCTSLGPPRRPWRAGRGHRHAEPCGRRLGRGFHPLPHCLHHHLLDSESVRLEATCDRYP